MADEVKKDTEKKKEKTDVILNEKDNGIYQLAKDLSTTWEDYDPYGFDDAYDSMDDCIQAHLDLLIEDKDSVISGIEDFIKDEQRGLEMYPNDKEHYQGWIDKWTALLDRVKALDTGKVNESIEDSKYGYIRQNAQRIGDMVEGFIGNMSEEQIDHEIKMCERIGKILGVKNYDDVIAYPDDDWYGTYSPKNFDELVDHTEKDRYGLEVIYLKDGNKLVYDDTHSILFLYFANEDDYNKYMDACDEISNRSYQEESIGGIKRGVVADLVPETEEKKEIKTEDVSDAEFNDKYFPRVDIDDKEHYDYYQYKGKNFAYDKNDSVVIWLFQDVDDEGPNAPWRELDSVGLSHKNWDDLEKRNGYLDTYISDMEEESNAMANDFIKYELPYYEKNGMTESKKITESKKVYTWNGKDEVPKDVVNVAVQDGVTEIKEFAFNGHYNLKSVTVPNSVKHIGMSAFRACPKLTVYTDNNYVKWYCKGNKVPCEPIEDDVMDESLELQKGKRQIKEGSRGFVKKYKGCSIHEFSDIYVVTDKYGKNIYETKSGIPVIEAWIDEMTEDGLLKENTTESLELQTEDVVKKANGKWTNRGKDGKEHGEFDTKKQALAQMRAMYAGGYKGEALELKTEGIDSSDKIVIYKALGTYHTTPESNYNKRISNARADHEIRWAKSADEIIDYYIKYGWADSKDDFIVIDESVKTPVKEEIGLELKIEDEEPTEAEKTISDTVLKNVNEHNDLGVKFDLVDIINENDCYTMNIISKDKVYYYTATTVLDSKLADDYITSLTDNFISQIHSDAVTGNKEEIAELEKSPESVKTPVQESVIKEDVNPIADKLIEELKDKFYETATTEEWGFTSDEEVTDYLDPHIEYSMIDNDDEDAPNCRIEVRFEPPTFMTQRRMGESLDTVLKDNGFTDAYFDDDTYGIMSAYVDIK